MLLWVRENQAIVAVSGRVELIADPLWLTALDAVETHRVTIATLRAWIGFRLNPNGKYRLEELWT